MRSSWSKLGLLGTLYLSQGLPYGFFVQALPVMMREQGVSLADIGLTSLLALPWALKFLWAPLVDGVGWPRLGLRRSWILPLQSLSVLTLLILGFGIPGAGEGGGIGDALGVVLAGVFVVNLLAATQDIATDGLAVTILRPRERGLGNGLQVAGYRLGMIIGGGALLVVHDRLGWSMMFAVMAGLLALASVPIVMHRERASVEPAPHELAPHEPALEPEENSAAPRDARARWSVDWGSLLAFARRPGMPLWLLVVASYKTGAHLATAMLGPMMSDLGLTLEDVGLIKGTAGFVAGLLGALAGGALVNTLGRGRALVAFGLLQAVAVTSFALPVVLTPTMPLLYGVTIAEHFTSGMATAALFTMMMDASRPSAAGSDYTLQASVVVLTTIAAASVSGFSADLLGYAWHFALAGLLCALAIVPVLMYLSQEGASARAGE